MPIETRFRSNESFGLEKPEFDCGKFTMVFSQKPQGFEIETDKSLPRRDENSPLPFTSAQKQQLKLGIQNQFSYTTADQAKIALNAYRANRNDPKLEAAWKEKNQQYRDHISIVTGIRDVRRSEKDPNTIRLNIRPVSLPMTAAFASSETNEALKELSANSSTTIAIETATGEGIIQHRSELATTWPDSLAASASGYIDEIPFQQRLEKDKPSNIRRLLKKLTTQDVKDNALRETDEEIGLGKDAFKPSDVRIGAMIHERAIIHDEFVLSATTSLSPQQVMEKAKDSIRSKKLRPGEYREKFFFMDFSPENILKLVTEVECPIPDAHRAAFINRGYEKMLAKGSKNEADSWLKRAQEGVPKILQRIDRIVSDDLKKHPEKLTGFPQRLLKKAEENVERFKQMNPRASAAEIETERKKQIEALPKRNPNGYSIYYTPEEQGLKNAFAALDTAGVKYTSYKSSNEQLAKAA